MSTTMGSLQDGMVVPAHQSSKAALNSITIALSKALADSPIKVTSVCPGFVQTELISVNKARAPLTAEQAAETVVAATRLTSEDSTGAFVDANGTVPR